ncbi:MAG: beta-propeller fold lactonase family protein [Candidatus Solibacter sp.]|nr:beta-propeller fold lactonase family protein [Candidatus Solibacter sp.]
MKRVLTGSVVALALVALAADGPGTARFPSPIELAVSKEGARLFALCEGTDEVVVFDARSAKIVRRIKVGRVPKGLALSPDGTRLYVANSWSDSISRVSDDVSVVDLAAGMEVKRLAAGRGASYLALSPDGASI